MHDGVDPSQYQRCLPQSCGVQLRAIATDEHHRCIQLESPLRRSCESRAQIAIPLGANPNAVGNRYVAPSDIIDSRRYPQFHGADLGTQGVFQCCLEHAPRKCRGPFGAEGWNEPGLGQSR